MTAGTVVITGGILATVILLLIIAVLCYCRLQVRPRLLSASVALVAFSLKVCDGTINGNDAKFDGMSVLLDPRL